MSSDPYAHGSGAPIPQQHSSQAGVDVAPDSYPPQPPTQPQYHYPPPPTEPTVSYPPPPQGSSIQQLPNPALSHEQSLLQSPPQFQPPPGSSQPYEYSQLALSAGNYPPPPKRQSVSFGDDDPSNPIHYTRDPHKLVAYLVPFPKPNIKNVDPTTIPDRFFIYTPPPPPLLSPAEGEKEGKVHKVQRKWQQEVRSAKTSTAKTASWQGVKSKATKGIDTAMSMITSSSLDFVNRIPNAKAEGADHHGEHSGEGDTTHKTVGLEEMVLVYPQAYHSSPEQVQTEFINTMMRTKSKAQRDAILATGLLPVSAAIDILATVVWPFGGLLEVDSVWAYSSLRGAKTARSVTKRLTSSASSTQHHESEEQEMKGEKLRLNLTQSPRLDILQHYLSAKCAERDHHLFQKGGSAPTETDVLAAIGWAPSVAGGQEKNWEDEQWETEEVKDDMRATMTKAAKEWDKWCKAFAKDPEKALKK